MYNNTNVRCKTHRWLYAMTIWIDTTTTTTTLRSYNRHRFGRRRRRDETRMKNNVKYRAYSSRGEKYRKEIKGKVRLDRKERKKWVKVFFLLLLLLLLLFLAVLKASLRVHIKSNCHLFLRVHPHTYTQSVGFPIDFFLSSFTYAPHGSPPPPIVCERV